MLYLFIYLTMKQILFFIFIVIATSGYSQNFSTDISTAKTAYASGKLEDAHFALQQAMQEIDIIIGKKVIAMLPQKMDSYTANAKDDNVTANVGFIGTTIHRDYGQNMDVDLSIIGNSPLVGTLSTMLNAPLIGGLMRDANNKIIKVQGYKGQLQKTETSNGKADYTLQIPLGSSLIIFTGKNTTDSQITALANTIPLADIAKLIQ